MLTEVGGGALVHVLPGSVVQCSGSGSVVITNYFILMRPVVVLDFFVLSNHDCGFDSLL